MPRGLAEAGPAIAGAIFAPGGQATPIIICGVLKIGHDLALRRAFRRIKPPEERQRGTSPG
jgi:hypothetical protein